MGYGKPDFKRPVVLTLGTFDGVHRGHQQLLRLASLRAKVLGGETLAVAFERPPRFYFHPVSGPSLLTTPIEKERWLRAFGADRVETVLFGSSLARLTAGDFLRKLVRGRWGAKEIVVGFNFRFGRGREGDAAYLRRECPRLGLKVSVARSLKAEGEAVSSGRIRPLLLQGRLAEAEKLLGHPYGAEAPVVEGEGLGRRLGFPTANLQIAEGKILPPGVYAVRARLALGVDRKGLCNVGNRPTLGGGLRQTMEVHLLDFTGDLRGQNLRVDFMRRLREERRFPSLSALTAQIRRDESTVRGWPPRVWRRQ